MSVHPFAQHAALVELSRGLSAALAVDWDNVDLDQLPAQAELALQPLPGHGPVGTKIHLLRNMSGLQSSKKYVSKHMRMHV